MTVWRGVALAVALVGVGAGCRKPCPVLPTPPGPTVNDGGALAARVFPRLKDLSGAWVAGELAVSFDVVSKGAALAQRSNFFLVWYLDGEALAVSLFPDDGYHARMRSTKITEGPELVVEMKRVDVGNVGSEPTLAQTMTMTISPKNDRITQRWVFEGASADAKPVELVMTRVDPSAPPAAVPPPN